ncbi:MAG: sulfatase-like hydrolase/transferase [Byssovorax sp.]
MLRLPQKRAAIALTALLIPTLWIGTDLGIRGALLASAGASVRLTYAAGALLSLLVWGLAMEAARHPRRVVRVAALSLVGFLAAFGVGLQAFARGLTHAYIGRRAVMLALGVPDLAHAGYFAKNALVIGGVCLVPAALAIALALLRARRFGPLLARPNAFAAGAIVATLACMFTPFAIQSLQGLPPDVLWLHGTGGPLLRLAGLVDAPRSLPPGHRDALTATTHIADDAPSIVFLLGESLRRDAVCGARSSTCLASPRVDEAAPLRLGFSRAFSIASCTELVSTALWTGLPITASPSLLARAPLVWDYARARGYRTAYLTSQNLLYQQGDLFLQTSAIDRLREARDRQVDARVDEGSADDDLAGEALDFLEAGGPALVVVHRSNTHTPYRQTPGFTPFPVDGDDAARHRYRNSLVHDDALVGDLIARLRRGARGRRAIVIASSDHGEAWGEHGSYTHSFDLYAEQIDVPLWIDAPPDTLPREVLDRLRDDGPVRPVSTVDLAATLLDLVGALDEPAFRAPLAAIAGTSLLRPAPSAPSTLLWNCPPTRECPAEAFGIVAWPLKLHYVGHEAKYACHDLAIDPFELAPLPPARCEALRARLDRVFGAEGVNSLSPSER